MMKMKNRLLRCLTLLMILTMLLPGGIAEEDDKGDLFGVITINELVTSASPIYNSQGYDWIELKNTGRSSRKLSGWTLVLNDKKTYTFTSGTIAAGEYLRVYCTQDTLKKNVNCGYALPKKSGTLCLYDAQGTLVSRVSWQDLPGNIAWGRAADEGSYVLLEQDTPGKKNSKTGYATRSSAPCFETEPGFYDVQVTVYLTAEPGEMIYYTLDGTVPTEKSSIYEGPITITETTALRAAAKAPDQMMSEMISGTYFIDLDASFTVVSVICEPDSLYSAKGLLVKGSGSTPNYMQDWEYPANIEYFNDQGDLVISQLCGMKVAGGISRQKSQKSLAFFARSALGEDVFNFNPFPHRDYDSIKCFVLRAGGSEGLADGIRFRDALLTSLAMDSNCLVTDAAPALVYINGTLWGHCNIRQKANKYFIGALENVDEKDLDGIDILTQDGLVTRGSNADYKALSRFMKTHDLNDAENLEYVLSQLDVDSLFDCVAYQMAAGNLDLHNMRFYRVPGGKWKWMVYDLDTAMRTLGAQPIADFMKKVNEVPTEKFDHIPFTTLMKVPEMKDRFLRRLADILLNYFTYDYLYAQTMAWHDQLLPIITLHCTRWTSLTVEGWEKNIRTRLEYMHDRPARIPEHIQKYFKLTDAEVEEYFGEFLLACQS